MIKKILLTILYVIFLAKIWSVMSADESYMDSQRFLKEGNFEKSLLYADKSIDKNSREQRYFYGKAKVLITRGRKVEALEMLERAENLNKNNIVTLRNMVPIYFYLSAEDINKPESAENIDEYYLGKISDFYQRLKIKGIDDVGIQTLLAKYEKRLGLMEGYIESMENIEKLRPDLLEWFFN